MNTKKTRAVSLAVIMMAVTSQAALFTQDFSSSTVVGDYIDATTPSQNQLTLVNGGATSIDAGRLKIVNAAGTSGNVRRWIDMEGTPVGGMSFSFDMTIDVAAGLAAKTRLYTGTIGEPDSGNHFMAWGIDATGVENEWNYAGQTSLKFTGAQTLTVVLNDSGAAFDYTDPLLGTQTLATNSYDVWIGTTLVADGKTGGFTHPEKDLTAFNLGLKPAPAATYYFDNFNVTAIPEPAVIGMIGLGGLSIILVRRKLNL